MGKWGQERGKHEANEENSEERRKAQVKKRRIKI